MGTTYNAQKLLYCQKDTLSPSYTGRRIWVIQRGQKTISANNRGQTMYRINDP